MTSDILVTGAAGFIGFHLCQRLCEEGHSVTGIDNLNDYYDPALKDARLARLAALPNFRFQKMDIADREAMDTLFRSIRPHKVFHLAAQAGVRYSIDHPQAYIDSNLVGFANVLEGCRQHGTEHLVFASSSSVYGANTKLPFATTDTVDSPISLYAATKKSNELMAHSYAHLYDLPVTGLRFFTVYGPWGRPDMAYYSFADAMMEGRPIRVYNHGEMQRDFTYIDDIIEGVVRVPKPQREDGRAAYKIYNIGNHQPVPLMEMIHMLEGALGVRAELDMQPMQPGDVKATYADIDDLSRDTGFAPRTPLRDGLNRFAAWYKDYHRRG